MSATRIRQWLIRLRCHPKAFKANMHGCICEIWYENNWLYEFNFWRFRNIDAGETVLWRRQRLLRSSHFISYVSWYWHQITSIDTDRWGETGRLYQLHIARGLKTAEGKLHENTKDQPLNGFLFKTIFHREISQRTLKFSQQLQTSIDATVHS
jgi:hypothetical protein